MGNIHIIVSGPRNSGVSTVTRLIQGMLIDSFYRLVKADSLQVASSESGSMESFDICDKHQRDANEGAAAFRARVAPGS
jgi:uridine kinase